MNNNYNKSVPALPYSVIYRLFIIFFLFVIAAGFSCRAAVDDKSTKLLIEPNAEIAANWWQPHRNVWTPIGWKDHLFRYNVVYNGTIIADPHPWDDKKHTEKWAGQGVQLTITPSEDGKFPSNISQEPYQLSSAPDGGVGTQGWTGNPTPVLWTEWRFRTGITLRKEIFAHIPEAGDVVSGIEPLYAWIRLSVSHVDELQAPENISFIIKLGAVHIKRNMFHGVNLTVIPKRSAYPRKLTSESFIDGANTGIRILEEDGRFRLVGISSEIDVFTFVERELDTRHYYLRVTLPVRKESYVDILLPMIPGGQEDVNAEMDIGFEEALNESDKYWSITPKTAAQIETPEKQINEAILRSVKFAQLISEKNPETGEYSFLSGSWQYDALWPTPTSMTSHMLLDILGYHSVVEKHIEIFKKNQGTVKPPGPSYKLHQGYFSSPKSLTSIDWLSDHGAILYEVCKHALLSGDQKFIDHWMEAIIKACEFIKDARKIKEHDGVIEVLPPAVATDRMVPTQSVWNIGWNYKGLSSAVRLLMQDGHPRAEEFATEAHDYKETFVKALYENTNAMPRWTDNDGYKHKITPHTLSSGGNIFHPFYLDTGPLFLVWSGLLESNDELMRETIHFFKEGPNTKLYDIRNSIWQRPVLVHEISSCEPCYSWNIYHSWQIADRYHFLKGMYSLLVGALSSQTYISCETRHGIYGNIFASTLLIDLIRLSVIDDVIHEEELHLLRLVPKAWLRTEYETRFENMPTEFGLVTIKFKLNEDRKALDVSYQAGFRHHPKKVLLHVPPVAGLNKVIINGKSIKAKPGDLLTVE